MENKFIELTDLLFTDPKENTSLEYKTAAWNLPKSFWETYSSFANTDGGIIVLGVSEDKRNKTYHVDGVDNPSAIKTDLWNMLSNSEKVNKNLLTEDDVLVLKVRGKTIIQIKIHKATFDQRPIFINNRRDDTYIRTDDGDRKATPEEYKYMIVDSQNDIDTELLKNFDMDDINLDTVEDYKKLYSKNKSDVSILKKDNEEFLIDLGVFRRDRRTESKKRYLTVGGLLFFGKFNSIIEKFPNFQIDYIKKRNSNSLEWIDRVSTGDMNFEDLNIFSFYRIVETKIPNGIQDTYSQDSEMTRGSYYSDMREAVKEATVNTLMHAYYDSDTAIKIMDYDDYFEFYNPGEMRVTVDEFLRGSVSRTRNSIISILFRRVGIAEKEAKGGKTIASTVINYGLRSPDIHSGTEDTRIRIWKTDMESTMYNLDTLEKSIMRIAIHTGVFKLKMIKEELEKEKISISDYKLRKNISSLEEKNYIYHLGKGAATRYYMNQSNETGRLSVIQLIKEIEDSMY